MDPLDLMASRHTVRRYKHDRIPEEFQRLLTDYINDLNKENGFYFQIFFNHLNMFNKVQKTMFAKNVSNYLALVIPEDIEIEYEYEQKAGWNGSEFMLLCQKMGMNTWWVGDTFSQAVVCSAVKLKYGQKLLGIICFGYGQNNGVPHKSKTPDQVSTYDGERTPEWFERGVKAALLAPTAKNKQDFMIKGKDNKVEITYEPTKHSGVDSGIVMQHFFMGAGGDNFEWEY